MKIDCTGFTPWKGMQSTALKLLENVTARYCQLRLPTGGGKSWIAMAAAQGAGSAFLVVPQNILLDQYVGKNGLPVVRGRKHYDCRWAERIGWKVTDYERERVDRKKMNCEEAEDKYPAPEEWTPDAFCHSNLCVDYIPSRNTFWEASISATNLHFLQFAQPTKSALSHRSLLVVDECHGLEPMLLSLAETSILRRDAKALGADYGDFGKLRKDYMQLAEHVADSLGRHEEPEIRIGWEDQRKRIKSTAEKLGRIVLDDPSDPWHIWRDPAPDKDCVIFKPIFARKLAGKLLGMADRVLFMSGTPGAPEHFFANLGITSDYDAVDIVSDWPAGDIMLVHPKQFVSTPKLNNPATGQLKAVANQCGQILRQMPTEKGLILCASYALSVSLADELRPEFKARMVTHTNEQGDKARAIAEHNKSNLPTVLIGVACHEGLDLPDEKARFVIIPKVLFANLGDPWIKKRMELDPGYYERRAAADTVQAAGRGVRAKEDWGYIFILDSSIVKLMEKVPNEFPPHFKAAFYVNGEGDPRQGDVSRVVASR